MDKGSCQRLLAFCRLANPHLYCHSPLKDTLWGVNYANKDCFFPHRLDLFVFTNFFNQFVSSERLGPTVLLVLLSFVSPFPLILGLIWVIDPLATVNKAMNLSLWRYPGWKLLVHIITSDFDRFWKKALLQMLQLEAVPWSCAFKNSSNSEVTQDISLINMNAKKRNSLKFLLLSDGGFCHR